MSNKKRVKKTTVKKSTVKVKKAQVKKKRLKRQEELKYWKKTYAAKIHVKTETEQKVTRGLSSYKGMQIKARKNAKNQYRIIIRWNDYSFPWLGWSMSVSGKSIWDIINMYPWKVIEWIYRKYGIDIVGDTLGDTLEFFLKTRLIDIYGNPPDHAMYKLELVVRSIKQKLEFA